MTGVQVPADGSGRRSGANVNAMAKRLLEVSRALLKAWLYAWFGPVMFLAVVAAVSWAAFADPYSSTIDRVGAVIGAVFVGGILLIGWEISKTSWRDWRRPLPALPSEIDRDANALIEHARSSLQWAELIHGTAVSNDIWDAKTRADFDKIGEYLTKLGQVPDALFNPDLDIISKAIDRWQELRRNYDAVRKASSAARQATAFWTVVLLVLSFLIIPSKWTTVNCAHQPQVTLTTIVGLAWFAALSYSVGPVLWNLMIGRVEPAFEKCNSILEYFKRQYQPAPTLTLIMWLAVLWASYGALFRYSYDEDSSYIYSANPSGNEIDSILTITDHVTGRIYRRSFTLDECNAARNPEGP